MDIGIFPDANILTCHSKLGQITVAFLIGAILGILTFPRLRVYINTTKCEFLYTAHSVKVVSDNSQIYNMSAKRMMGIIIVWNSLNISKTTPLYLYTKYSQEPI